MDEGGSGNIADGSSVRSITEAMLIEQFRSRLVIFAIRRTGDADAAEDVAQETLRRVLVACREGRLENLAALPAFVYQTARNVCLQGARTFGRERRALQRISREPEDTGSDPLAGLVSRERTEIVCRALERIAQSDRELLRSIFWEGLSHEVLAGQMEIAPQALRVRKHRALKRLARYLKGELS